jgi:uncharacterized protein YijF (DUF1287 family)
MKHQPLIASERLGGLCALFFLIFSGVVPGRAGEQHAGDMPQAQPFVKSVPIVVNGVRFTQVQPQSAIAAKIVAGAKAQIGNIYDASYVRIPYPNGDVPHNRGLCADVVVRALRAVGYDLQQLIHEDRRRNFNLYPKTWGWGRNGPDPNTDHRCVPNQMFFFQRYGLPLTTEVSPRTLNEWQPGDIVYWDTGSPLHHAGVVSDIVNASGVPLVIHMSQARCELADRLLTWPIIGHFRYPVQHSLQHPSDAQHPSYIGQ